ncbi:MAG: DUF362 domain-containing protein [Armatimonadetes bacterium]|nr:DUF362 domain-containing protein [Armatimonadota bacterium]
MAASRDRRARVALAMNTGLARLEDEALYDAVAALTHRAVCDATGIPDPRQAWRSLFRSEDVVAVKLNCLAPQLAPSPGIVRAIVQGLGAVGIPPNHIIFYDKEDRDLEGAGFTLCAEGEGPYFYGTIGRTKNPGYEERFTLVGETSFRLTKIVTREATAIINVPVVKHHEYAGMTGALKNHFGSIHNPEDFHKFACDPAISDVNRAVAITSKQRLIIFDALRILYDGGPAYQPGCVMPYWAVMASTDAVAIDTKVCQLIDLCRQQKGLPPLADLHYPPKHIRTAAAAGVGIGDDDRIDLIVYQV